MTSHDGEGSEVGSPRGSFRLLADPIFGPFVVGRIISTAGVWIHNIVAALLVYELTQSALVVGLVSAAQWSPQILAPWSGALADRGDRRGQLVAGRLVTAIGSGGLAFWINRVGADGLPGSWVVLLAAFIVGLGFLIGTPAMQSLVPSLVHADELPTAIALDSLPMTVGRAGGPALGAALVSTSGPAVALGIAALSQLLFAGILLAVPINGRTHHLVDDRDADHSVRAAIDYMRTDPVLILLLVGVCAIGVGVEPPLTLAPAISEAMGAGDTLVGTLVSSFGLGAAIGFSLLGPVRRRSTSGQLGSLGLWALGAGMLIVALGSGPTTALGGFLLAGLGLSFSVTGLTTALQKRLDEGFRGRIMALWLLAIVGVRPITSIVSGAVADIASPDAALTVTATTIFVIAWFVRPAKLRSRHEAASSCRPPARWDHVLRVAPVRWDHCCAS